MHNFFRAVAFCLVALIFAPNLPAIDLDANDHTPTATEAIPVLEVARRAYSLPLKSFDCPTGTKPKKRPDINALEKIFSKEIIDHFVKNPNNCGILGGFRFGTVWESEEDSLKKYRTKFYGPFLKNNKTVVEVRFWSATEKTAAYAGGAILYMKNTAEGWRIDNMESVDTIGANGFSSLLADYPVVSDPNWKDKDYSKSLINPTDLDYSPRSGKSESR